MNTKKFEEALHQLLELDPRYPEQAYILIREALDFTIKTLNKPVEGDARHISATELMEGIRQFVLQEYGPMTKTILNEWGIYSSEDFGEIVFNLVAKGILGKTEKDRKEDFMQGYDFNEAFSEPFRPHSVH
ncbi:MAG: hypothetical protein GKR87_07945 [Kiritimatiellae bacterium]|nr:hypothetical protein [Kiritimatiellia bacterium]